MEMVNVPLSLSKYRGRAQDPGVYCATPGCGINPLRGKNRVATLVPNTIDPDPFVFL